MSRTDSWVDSIVRGRDGRKGRVTLDARPVFGRRYLGVHWDNDQWSEVPPHKVVMLRPPLGWSGILPPEPVLSARQAIGQMYADATYGPLLVLASVGASVGVVIAAVLVLLDALP